MYVYGLPVHVHATFILLKISCKVQTVASAAVIIVVIVPARLVLDTFVEVPLGVVEDKLVGDGAVDAEPAQVTVVARRRRRRRRRLGESVARWKM